MFGYKGNHRTRNQRFRDVTVVVGTRSVNGGMLFFIQWSRAEGWSVYADWPAANAGLETRSVASYTMSNGELDKLGWGTRQLVKYKNESSPTFSKPGSGFSFHLEIFSTETRG